MPSLDEALGTWLGSAGTVRICGLDFTPLAHPRLARSVLCVTKGQAAVYFLRQRPHGNSWLLKRFAPGRRPSDAYLRQVPLMLPGNIAFCAGTQRRLVTSAHIGGRCSSFYAPELSAWAVGSLLMPKVPGTSWSAVADDLRDGVMERSRAWRLRAAIRLADCVRQLEAAGCAHRDLSGSNVFITADADIYCIDWDAVFGSSLPLPAHTTAGTRGYTAPFTRNGPGIFDARQSWCPRADRYALAILIAELPLVSPARAIPQEDGSLFAQAHLDDPGHDFVREQAEALCRLDLHCGVLLLRALHARSFAECPAPAAWIRALCRAARIRQPAASRRHPTLTSVHCEHCQGALRIPRALLSDLRERGRPLLCRTCLYHQCTRWQIERLLWYGGPGAQHAHGMGSRECVR